MKKASALPSAVKNRKAFHEYQILESFEAGIALRGTEVKSIRAGKINISDGWVRITDDLEAWLMQAHISLYSHGNINNHVEQRPRKLLIKKSQIKKLYEQTKSQGITLVPLKVYFKNQLVKVEVALARGKKSFDKRESEKERDAERDMARAIRGS